MAVMAVVAGVGCGAEREVTVRFDARAGDQALRCGTPVEGLGTASSRYDLKDLRFYVHDVALLTVDGEAHPVTLTPDGTWQSSKVALLDFEDRSGECLNGTEQMRDVVVGTAADEDFTGVRFRVGVPAEVNHDDASVAPAPLNLTSLFWSWRAGYKFIRLDGKTEGMPTGHNFHLGSTGCSEAPTTCEQPNVPEVTLTAFDVDAQTVVFDVASLFADSNLEQDHEGTAPGCMGAPTGDPDCLPMFKRLGLAGPEQQVFRAGAQTP